VIFFSLGIGCLEEGYFRYYLPQRIRQIREEQGLIPAYPDAVPFLVSALIFAFCHAYEGPWGFTNALLAALALSVIYAKSLSFPGIALAHGLYNIFVYLSVSLNGSNSG
jgi:membrane protease YdiL (CAAX protease family)